jgi:hypothetical protein
VQTTTGHAFGTQPGTASGAAVYADSTAILTGTWGPTQSAQGTVFVTQSGSGAYEEVEILLRSSVSAHVFTGYEINGSVSVSRQYVAITRWNGALGSFQQLAVNNNVPTLKTGDTLGATISGNTITAYLNGTQILQAVDNTFTNGNPAVGFFINGANGLDANYGFSNFSATDETDLLTAEPTSASPNPTPAVGQADLIWENTTTGEHSIWIMQNGVPARTIELPTIPIQWHVAAAADFLGTGQADLVW